MPAPSDSDSPSTPTTPHSNLAASTSADPAPLFLRHILTCPPSDAIPLRNMYASNLLAQQRARTPSPSASAQAKAERTRSPSAPGHRMPPRPEENPNWEPSAVEAMHLIPCPAQSLPPSFITAFVRRVFTEDLCLVDFTQALTAMDYLKVLDDRKRRELAAALRRLDVNVEMLGKSREELHAHHPRLADWLSMIDDKGRKVEALYTQVYIGLRRWTLINEMRLTPFNKQNCIAMLNALYPPRYAAPPTVQLTETILNAQRNAFFRYIQAVEKSGRGVLSSLELSGRRPGNSNGWPVVRDLIDVYLTRSNEIIEECMSIINADSFGGKRADSGVSFGSQNSGQSSHILGQSAFLQKSLPPLPLQEETTTPSKKKLGRFETFARELRRIKSKSADHKDDMDLRSHATAHAAAAAKANPFRGLRKMRSTTALAKDGNQKEKVHSRGNSSDRGARFDVDDAQRERLLRAARLDKESRGPTRAQSPVAFPLAQTPTPMSRAATPDDDYSFPWQQPSGIHHQHPPVVPWYAVPEPRMGEAAMPAELSA